MASINFVNGTIIPASWLNDVDEAVYVDVPTAQIKLQNLCVSIAEQGGIEGLSNNNTTAFNNCLTALGADGGVIFFPPGDWRGDFLVNQNNITIQGSGGVGELEHSCIRPWTTGASSFALKISNGTRVNRKCAIRDVAICADNGAGTECDYPLWLSGGTYHFEADRLDLMGGKHSLHMEPSGGYPVTIIYINGMHIRNDNAVATTRAIYVERKLDATGPDGEYTTGIYFDKCHINGPGDGYVLELKGNATHGLVVHMSDTYVDGVVAKGIYMHGWEVLLCGGRVHFDMGASGVEVIKRNDLTKDPTRFISGNFYSPGNLVTFSDLSTITLPNDNGPMFYQPLLRSVSVIGPVYWGNALDPYQTTINEDMTGAAGYKLFTGGQGDGIATANGGRWLRGSVSELFSVNTGSAVTTPSLIQLPADSVIEAVVTRVTTAITTAASYTLGDATTVARFATGGAVALGSTLVGTLQHDGTGVTGPRQASAVSPKITFNATPGAGAMRMTIFFSQFVAPTS